jgi:N utilization substance protein B
MLNRRLLRIKVMQALYAYQQAVAADLQLAQDRIAAAFEPDLMADVAPDRRLLEGQRKLGEAQLREWHRTGELPETGSDDKEVAAALRTAIDYYQQLVKKEGTFYGGQLMHGAESIHDQYLHLLNLPQALLEIITEDNEREARRFTGPRFEAEGTARLFSNAAFAKLKENEQLLQTTIKHKQKEIKPDEAVQAYLGGKNTGLVETDYETDMELVRHLYKDFVFKGEALPRWLEANDLNWEENRPIVRNLVLKTLKMLPYAADEKQELMNLSANWQDDRDFAETLYNQTLQDDAKSEKLIAESVQNWDVERVALLDKIILKMALCEMQLFRGIPVKVTINEYIEISKLYSTPKSKQFVNGILDKLAQDLAASGEIRKSGRGLLDNQ